jgi:hypothetical protein
VRLEVPAKPKCQIFTWSLYPSKFLKVRDYFPCLLLDFSIKHMLAGSTEAFTPACIPVTEPLHTFNRRIIPEGLLHIEVQAPVIWMQPYRLLS